MSESGSAGDLLAICTRNRSQDVAACFAALIKCPDVPSLVIVVDSSEGDDTEKVCESVAQIPDKNFQIMYARALPGLTHQRNVALDLAPDQCDVIFFIDDDSLAIPGYFHHLREVFRLQPSCVGVGAQVVAVDPSGDPLGGSVSAHNGMRSTLRDIVKSLFALQPQRGRVNAAALNGNLVNPSTEAIEVDWLSGCAMSFRLSAARRTRFNEDELSGYALGEDVEFCLRIKSLGRLMLAPRTHMRHVLSPANRLNGREMTRMSIRNRYVFVRAFPDQFSRAAYWWSVTGLLLMAIGARNWAGASGVVAGIVEIGSRPVRGRSRVVLGLGHRR